MTMEEVTRLIDRLVEQVKLLERGFEQLEYRVDDVERDNRYLETRIEDLEYEANLDG